MAASTPDVRGKGELVEPNGSEGDSVHYLVFGSRERPWGGFESIPARLESDVTERLRL